MMLVFAFVGMGAILVGGANIIVYYSLPRGYGWLLAPLVVGWWWLVMKAFDEWLDLDL